MDILSDSCGRTLDYARISVTDRCNYRCVYCMPQDGVASLGHEDVMRYEEIIFLCGVLSELGIRKIRFTGGEPLVRKGFVPFLKHFRKSFPAMAVALTTNASLLARYAADLAAIGLSGLNVSLDTVDAGKFKAITRVGRIEDVFAGIDAAVRAGIRNIKTNTVLIRGFNDDELMDIVGYVWSKGASPRLIEFMPLGDDVWNSDKFISSAEILRILSRHGTWLPLDAEARESSLPPMGPAKYYREASGGRTVGIIEAVSNHFCASCNRLRFTAAGGMKICLFSPRETNLLAVLRAGDRDALRAALFDEMSFKPDRWESVRDGTLRMSGIGG